MRFQTAFNWMKHGKKMTCAGFLGYWYWDNQTKEIIIVTKNNESIRLKDTPDWDFTFGFINSDEWDFYNGDPDPRKSQSFNI